MANVTAEYQISKSSNNRGRPYYGCCNCDGFVMWAAPKGNVCESEPASRGPSMKMQGIEDEDKRIVIQIYNVVKDIKMAMKLMETNVYDPVKILIVLIVVICISVMIMSMK